MAQIKKILFALSSSAPQPHLAKKPSINWSLPFLTGSFRCLQPPQTRPSRLALQIMTLVFPPSFFSSTQMYWPSRNHCSGLPSTVRIICSFLRKHKKNLEARLPGLCHSAALCPTSLLLPPTSSSSFSKLPPLASLHSISFPFPAMLC